MVIGVHSPKFAHEQADATVRAAVERNEIAHPVLNDPQLALWRQYAVKAWPTLVLIDPDGYVVAQAAGEGQVSALDRTIADLSPHYSLRRGDEPYRPTPPEPSTLRFPAKAIALPSGNLLVADAGHHQLVELHGDEVVRRIGDGARGRSDDPLRFAEPNGLALLGDDVWSSPTPRTTCCARYGCPTARWCAPSTSPHELRDARTVTGPIPAVLSPWDVAWWPAIGKLVVAAAGVHLLLAVDPGHRRDRGAGRHHRRGAARRAGRATAGWPSRPDSPSTATGCGSSTPRPRRCATSPPTARCTPRSARGCSTSATSTARPRPRGCSTRSASRCSPTARSPCSTPTTARCAATTRPPIR